MSHGTFFKPIPHFLNGTVRKFARAYFYENPNLLWDMFENANIQQIYFAMANGLPMEKQTFITNRYIESHRLALKQVCMEVINTMLHPDNFPKFDEWEVS